MTINRMSMSAFTPVRFSGNSKDGDNSPKTSLERDNKPGHLEIPPRTDSWGRKDGGSASPTSNSPLVIGDHQFEMAEDNPIKAKVLLKVLENYNKKIAKENEGKPPEEQKPLIKYSVQDNGAKLVNRLKKLKAEGVDLNSIVVLTDLEMPVMGGLEAIEKIKEEVSPDIEFNVFSAAPNLEKEAKEAGAVDFIPAGKLTPKDVGRIADRAHHRRKSSSASVNYFNMPNITEPKPAKTPVESPNAGDDTGNPFISPLRHRSSTLHSRKSDDQPDIVLDTEHSSPAMEHSGFLTRTHTLDKVAEEEK